MQECAAALLTFFCFFDIINGQARRAACEAGVAEGQKRRTGCERNYGDFTAGKR